MLLFQIHQKNLFRKSIHREREGEQIAGRKITMNGLKRTYTTHKLGSNKIIIIIIVYVYLDKWCDTIRLHLSRCFHCIRLSDWAKPSNRIEMRTFFFLSLSLCLSNSQSLTCASVYKSHFHHFFKWTQFHTLHTQNHKRQLNWLKCIYTWKVYISPSLCFRRCFFFCLR